MEDDQRVFDTLHIFMKRLFILGESFYFYTGVEDGGQQFEAGATGYLHFVNEPLVHVPILIYTWKPGQHHLTQAQLTNT
jgi:hypothetical protein